MTDRICSFPECGRPLLCKGLCNTHYLMQHRGEALRPLKSDLPPRYCTVPGCDRGHYAKGMCQMHWGRTKRNGGPGPAGRVQPEPYRAGQTCTLDGCPKPLYTRLYCEMHDRRWRLHGSTDDPRPSLEVRYWSKVDKTEGCWLWTSTHNLNGYGVFNIGGRAFMAHRLAYEWATGPIPEGLHLDHLCRVRNCVRPDHLDPVTPAENMARVPKSDTCKNGHEFTPENTRYDKAGWRRCAVCIAASKRRSYLRLKEQRDRDRSE